PVSRTRVPAGGDWRATVLAAYPCTEPMTCHAKPVSSSVPLAKTKAWPDKSGTTSVAAATGAGAPFGTAVIRFAAPTASVALASRRTTPTIARRGKRVAIRRAMLCESAESRLDSSPTASEADDGIPRIRDDGEDPRRHGGGVGQFERRGRGCVLPRKGAARKALEPGLVLREFGRRLQLQVEVRTARVPGRADKPDLSSGRQGDPVHDRRLQESQVAVCPDEPVHRADRQADAATRVGGVPGVEHNGVRDGIYRRSLRGGDVRCGVV